MNAEDEQDGPGMDVLVEEWLTLEEVAQRLGTSANRVRQAVRERELIAVRTPAERRPRVPALCLQDDHPVKGLSGTLTLLSDVGFEEDEAARWMFTPDDSLPGRPIDALREDRGREVRRRAQALAF